MPDIALRTAAPADVDAIVALAQSAYRGEAASRGWTSEAQLISGERTNAGEVAALIAGADSAILVARLQGEIVGCVHVEVRDGVGHLGLLAVDPDRQSAGLGRRLVGAAETLAQTDLAAGEIRLHVIHSRGELIAWYERRGYRRTGAVADFPADKADPGPTPVDLHFVELAKALA